MIRRELGVFALFVAMAVAFTWPLALHMNGAVADLGDPLLVSWILDWDCYAFIHAPLHLYDAPIFHGGIKPLAYSENMIGIALVMLPFHLFGASPVTLHSLAVILGLAFSAYGASVLARVVTRNLAASLVGGIFFGFSSFMLSHLQHAHILWSGWLPLTLAALLLYWRKATAKRAALLGGAFLMNALCNVYWFLFALAAVALTIALLHVAAPRRERAFWLRLLGALALACAVMVPVLLPYQRVSREYGMRRTSGEARRASATWTDWLVPSSRSLIYGKIPDPNLRRAERELFPGLFILFLASYAWLTRPRTREREQTPSRSRPALDLAIAVGLILTYFTTVQERITLGRFSFAGADVPAVLTLVLLMIRFAPQLRARIRNSRFTPEELSAALWIVIGVIASLGWNAFLQPFLFRIFPPFRATRTPARWAVIACVGLAVWGAMGAAALLARRTHRRRAMAALLILLATVDVLPRIRWTYFDPAPAPVYRWLQETRPGVVLELPMIREGAAFQYVLANAYHRVPIINGTSGWETPLHELLRKKEEALQYDDEFYRAIAEQGCTIVIVHEARLDADQRRALPPLLSKLKLVRRFGRDAVYVLARPIT
ncbi:MAG TPA: hypothetical protein VF824_22535 [Thermoanaerobaculia bacterium]